MTDNLILSGIVLAWVWLLTSIYSYGRSRRFAKRKSLPALAERNRDFVTCHNLLRLDNRAWGRYCNTVVPLTHELPIMCPRCKARVM